jgi:PAS domain S-box-containing protein
MSQGVLLFINEGQFESAVIGQVISSVETAEQKVELYETISEGIERINLLVKNNTPPNVIVIGKGIKTTGQPVRQIHEIVPNAQIIFLKDELRSSALPNASLAFSSVPGTHWSVASASNPDSLLKTIQDSLKVAKQRRFLRTTLDKINLKLESSAAVDSSEVRKLVISDRYLASILTQAQDAIISTDLNGKIISVNKAAQKSFCFAEEEMLGESIEKLIAFEQFENLKDLIKEVSAKGIQSRTEMIARRSDGSDFDIDLSVAVVKDENENQQLGMVFIAHDITEHKRREQRLEELLQREKDARRQAIEANRLKDEFLATVSHELRTPLNAILGWATMLRSGVFNPEAVSKAIETIERNARTQAQLIEDLLDVSRIITGNLRLDVRPIDPVSFIEAAIEAVRPAAESKRIRIQTILDTGLASIFGDSQRLQQVVWNLLSNAVKFTPKNGRVVITLERINSHIEITVSDTGEGIEPEFLPSVFERFSQGDASSTRRHGGLGLGLAIVRHIVELHGGTVHVFSEGKGKGTKFTVKLPLLPVYQNNAAEDRVHPSVNENYQEIEFSDQLNGISILIVDDEKDSIELLKTALKQFGATVLSATSSRSALELLKQESFDLLISDIEMPEEDGYTLIKKMRSLPANKGGEIPAVALTAYARTEDRLKALRAGFQMHMAKPVEINELLEVVSSLINRRKPEKT